MSAVILSSQVDAADNIRFTAFCDSVGITTNTAINMFIKAVLRENRIPFEISQGENNFYNKSNIDFLITSKEELENGNVVTKSLAELEAMEGA